MAAILDFTNERVAIQSAFKVGFIVNALAPYPVKYENQPFNKVAGKPYCVFHIVGGKATEGEIGGTMARAPGIVYMQMFLPEDGGVEDFNIAAGIFAGIFNRKVFYLPNGYCVFKLASVTTVGKDADSGMYQKNASIEFRRDTFTDALFAPNPIPDTLANVKFDAEGNIYFYNPDAGAYQRWEPRGEGDAVHFELTA